MESEVANALSSLALGAINESLQLSDGSRQKISEGLYQWLLTVKKTAVPDLPVRLERMRAKFHKLSKELELEVDAQSNITLTATTLESEILISQLHRGSDWFAPHPNLGKSILTQVTGETV